MYQGLQDDGRQNGGTYDATGAAKVILNGEYAAYARNVVKNAKYDIRICAYAWRWYDSRPETPIQMFNTELVRAVKRGVQVRAIVDNVIIKEMLEARGIRCVVAPGIKSCHAKVISGDLKDIVVGSHNLTMRAFDENIEISILTHEYEPIAQFIEYFDRMWVAYG